MSPSENSMLLARDSMRQASGSMPTPRDSMSVLENSMSQPFDSMPTLSNSITTLSNSMSKPSNSMPTRSFLMNYRCGAAFPPRREILLAPAFATAYRRTHAWSPPLPHREVTNHFHLLQNSERRSSASQTMAFPSATWERGKMRTCGGGRNTSPTVGRWGFYARPFSLRA